MTPHPGITRTPFGQLPDGRATSLFTLRNRAGMVVSISDFGGVISAIHVPDRAGVVANVCLGFDAVEPYRSVSPFFGALIGRYANRIANGRFTLDGVAHQLDINDGANHLHGGALGFHRVLWQASIDEANANANANSDANTNTNGATADTALTLRYHSPDGEQGYPGALDVTVRYALGDDNELSISFDAVCDRATPVNLTNHAYFNLAGRGDILGHEIMIPADAYSAIDAALIPTGAQPSVSGTPFDFRQPQTIGARIDADHPQLRNGAGYDHNFVLNQPAPGARRLAARVREPSSGRVLEVFSDQPCLQFYSGNFLDGSLAAGGQYAYRGALCLEPQHCPDSPNRPQLPSTILRPGQRYRSVMAYRFSIAV
ncbi:aldose epimerase family protein [Rugamonas sp. CCM 8940]|uniref:aldose epimerase family protein n=1 Tax=Rugamonas sp. CCM 8940 TaxID=2765359 RepID=UPI0018F468A8|nr:aldose epimerase family protein [Rugamonas sp. CCM 8940]MBJ7312684.1 galactose mutarotase [Rugamonas sp. CCM 8940]